MRKKIIIGNWKMHLNASQASLLLHRLQEKIKIHRNVEVVLSPSTLVLQPLSRQLDRRKFRLAAQNAYHKDEGAYTGEVSFSMLQDLVHYAIIGHSERRNIFGESLETVRDKVTSCVRNDISPVICVGETRTEKLDGETKQVIHDQLTTAISGLTSEDIKRAVIAYEPVWAISGGKNYKDHAVAKPDDVAKIAAYIRHLIEELYGKKAAVAVRIIYGGSTNAENARSFLEVEGIDGLLPGGASLDYHAFSSMVKTAFELTHQD